MKVETTISVWKVISGSISLIVSVLTALFLYQQTQLQELMLDIQSSQGSLIAQQLSISEEMARLERYLAPPAVEYVRSPSFYLDDNNVEGRNPQDKLWRHSYPDNASFQTGVGFTSIKGVRAVYFGVLGLGPTCSANDGGTYWVDVSFADTLITGGYGHAVGTIPSSTYYDVINPGLQGRLDDFAKSLTDRLKANCVREVRVRGAFNVEFVDVRSQLHHQYFTGSLFSDMALSTEQEWDDSLERYLKHICHADLRDQALAQCAKNVSEQLEQKQSQG
ncbi:hypothetical protein HED22_16890 [Thalassospira sp. HF15]|uniref:hypothetical protein n=1 Tax=Thalassospira sp. HF15 TaxID=2722755 RepID=UPI00142F9BE6|nr:hypothetical protein [Thalassospira sp. HF15]NIY77332.1 hypothetical protein [Thalassospira sp. HF15]